MGNCEIPQIPTIGCFSPSILPWEWPAREALKLKTSISIQTQAIKSESNHFPAHFSLFPLKNSNFFGVHSLESQQIQMLLPFSANKSLFMPIPASQKSPSPPEQGSPLGFPPRWIQSRAEFTASFSLPLWPGCGDKLEHEALMENAGSVRKIPPWS